MLMMMLSARTRTRRVPLDRRVRCRRARSLAGVFRVSQISVGLYHTAGKGTRLSPLPGAENNNKPAVQLPVPAQGGCATILEVGVSR